jgi:guanosine-3',5'-bis(diphosphate) 3'-pyrophosphohydrolase
VTPVEATAAYSIDEVGSILRAARFAAARHSAQRRKSEDQEPYINHLIEVAEILSGALPAPDAPLLMAAFLHDSMEDVQVTFQELAAEFGVDVASLVAEVTDDKSLPRSERKAHQISHAAHLSPRAQSLGAADKIANLRSIFAKPPAGWNLERRREYLDWARQVVSGYPNLNPTLRATFDSLYARRGELAE